MEAEVQYRIRSGTKGRPIRALRGERRERKGFGKLSPVVIRTSIGNNIVFLLRAFELMYLLVLYPFQQEAAQARTIFTVKTDHHI